MPTQYQEICLVTAGSERLDIGINAELSQLPSC